MTTVLCVPQWQGSASRNASRLVAGARRTAGLVEAEALVTVPVLETGGEKKAGIRALDVLLENLRLTQRARASRRRAAESGVPAVPGPEFGPLVPCFIGRARLTVSYG